MKERVNILGVGIDNLSTSEVISIIEKTIKDRSIKSFFTPNVDFLVKAQKDKVFKDTLNESEVNFPDGKPLIWASKYLGTSLKEKVSGSSLFFQLCEIASKKHYRIFMLGAGSGVGEKAKSRLEKKYPGIQISGTYSPPYGFEKNQNEINKINQLLLQSKSDVLVVGLGAPKQEWFIKNNKSKYRIPVSLGLGGTIDFAAGTQRMAPNWTKKLGIAWLFRMMQDPQRLIRRYLIEDMVFFKLVWQQRRGKLL